MQQVFDQASQQYAIWFAEWLHIDFVIRTLIILLVLWGLLFVLVQVLQYVIFPIGVLIYRHVFFRAYHYLFIETPQEWLYIHYYAKDKPTFRTLYLRLTDKVKQNRLILNHTKYKGILHRGTVRRIAWVCVATIGVTATLWLTAFGLHHEYYVPALAGYRGGEEPATTPPVIGENTNNTISLPPTDNTSNELQENDDKNETPQESGQATPAPSDIIYPAGYINPQILSENVRLRLSPDALTGARLRDTPGFLGTVIQMVWEDAELMYTGIYIDEPFVPGLYWLQVRSADELTGYIASHLVVVVNG